MCYASKYVRIRVLAKTTVVASSLMFLVALRREGKGVWGQRPQKNCWFDALCFGSNKSPYIMPAMLRLFFTRGILQDISEDIPIFRICHLQPQFWTTVDLFKRDFFGSNVRLLEKGIMPRGKTSIY